ncbi:molybdenum cofactor biosynthesis protein MoaE [Roseisolibacter sp. H3M3-2]|uniref:molybdenum cofactor biosynthesis protein MoaE n=1 Tax=Roseisolibacter sp. H3M3-2 TaxID=3031323 RepID=UPI0023D992D8|nr:molybdenum cofactor biosynthesis protein MoaE [Roseisolibacter sp. H3M3-2]MDF1501482.1 molybdenum cofactor biosynthesis protein MoaE [Roseisolibacter sp. H3M3-2]
MSGDGVLVRDPIEPAALLARVAHDAAGAQAAFFGAVRDTNVGRAVLGIDYAAYEPMAAAELAAIAGEAEARWPGARVAVAHRIGTLGVGELSVGIAVTHPHRAQAFDACRFAIEAIKTRVPIWKREHYADGTREWVDAGSGAAVPAPAPVG